LERRRSARFCAIRTASRASRAPLAIRDRSILLAAAHPAKPGGQHEEPIGFAVGYVHIRPGLDTDPVLDRQACLGELAMDWGAFIHYGLMRWLHILAGVMWIGLLYYFNFVQVAALKAAQADNTAPGISRHVAPRALLFFRWAAVVTWLAGASILGSHFL